MLRRVMHVAVLATIAAACNTISGAENLGTCTGSECADASFATEPDGALPEEPPDDGPSDPLTEAGGGSDASVDVVPDAPRRETGTCAPNGGSCEGDFDCCSPLRCNASKKCVTTCKTSGSCSSNDVCCLGTSCAFFFAVCAQ